METVKELLSFYLSLSSEAANYWGVFITVNAAITGWLLARNEKLNNKLKIFGIVCYLLFSMTIYFALQANAIYIDAVVSDIRTVSSSDIQEAVEQFISDSTLRLKLQNIGSFTWSNGLKYIYLLSVLLISIAILIDIFKVKKS